MQCATCNHQNPSGAKVCSVCGSPLDVRLDNSYTPALPSGAQLHTGTYEINKELGQGGFGITYKGYDHSLRRSVAIKEFFPEGSIRQGGTVIPNRKIGPEEYASSKDKFIQEAHCLAQFSYPGIVRVFGIFEENNTAYMVMELLDGQSLEQYITDKGSLDEQEVVGIATKVGEALSVIHQAGLIHRDIKPDNIMRASDGRLVLIDFGTARTFDLDKTVNHTAMLTHGYAPLEQYGSRARFGAFTDIYALGASLYRALIGELPPPATDRVAGVDLKSPRDINPQISQTTSDAILRAMAVKAADRPQNVQEFLHSFKNSVPRPAHNPTADKQLREAKARAVENIEKWKKVIVAVHKAEKISGVDIPIRAHLLEGVKAADKQVKKTEWSSESSIEKEAASAYLQILSDANHSLKKAADKYKLKKIEIEREKILMENDKVRAENAAKGSLQNVRISCQEEFSIIGPIIAGVFAFATAFIVSCILIAIISASFAALALSNEDALKIAIVLSAILGSLPVIIGVFNGVMIMKRKTTLKEERASLIRNAELNCEEEIKRIDLQFGLKLSSLENVRKEIEQKELAINQGLNLLNI